jgi:hypothetical protein
MVVQNGLTAQGTPLQVGDEVAETTPASAAPQLGAHASSPVGQRPPTQSWAAPGAPPTPWHAHVQQPQSAAVEQAPPGGVLPGPCPAGALLEQARAVSARRIRTPRRVTRRR